jgi:hypothetical protein
MDRWRGTVDERLRGIDDRQTELFKIQASILAKLDAMVAWQNRVIGAAFVVPTIISLAALFIAWFRRM